MKLKILICCIALIYSSISTSYAYEQAGIRPVSYTRIVNGYCADTYGSLQPPSGGSPVACALFSPTEGSTQYCPEGVECSVVNLFLQLHPALAIQTYPQWIFDECNKQNTSLPTTPITPNLPTNTNPVVIPPIASTPTPAPASSCSGGTVYKCTEEPAIGPNGQQLQLKVVKCQSISCEVQGVSTMTVSEVVKSFFLKLLPPN